MSKRSSKATQIYFTAIFILVVGGLAALPYLTRIPEIDYETYQLDKLARLEPLAKEGDIDAQAELGRIYRGGIRKDGKLIMDISKSNRISFQWIKKAAENGHPTAKRSLPMYYECGIGTDKNIQEAIRLYTPYANSGGIMEQYALLRLAKDPKKAKYWEDRILKELKKCPGCDPPHGGEC